MQHFPLSYLVLDSWPPKQCWERVPFHKVGLRLLVKGHIAGFVFTYFIFERWRILSLTWILLVHRDEDSEEDICFKLMILAFIWWIWERNHLDVSHSHYWRVHGDSVYICFIYIYILGSFYCIIFPYDPSNVTYIRVPSSLFLVSLPFLLLTIWSFCSGTQACPSITVYSIPFPREIPPIFCFHYSMPNLCGFLDNSLIIKDLTNDIHI